MSNPDREPTEPTSEDRPDRPLATDETIQRIALLAVHTSDSEREVLLDRGTFLDCDRYGYFSYVVLDPAAPESIRNRVIAFDLEQEGPGSILDCSVQDLSAWQRLRRRFGRTVEPEVESTGPVRILSESQAQDLAEYLENLEKVGEHPGNRNRPKRGTSGERTS